MENSDRAHSAATLREWVHDARARSLELIADLDDDQLMGPKLPIVNPLLWEIGHAAWFQEHWVLQHVGGHKPIRADGHRLYDSIAIAHEVRWDLPLPSRHETLQYVGQVRDRVLEMLDHGSPAAALVYFVKLSVFHEDMHTEAFTYTRQTLGHPRPQLGDSRRHSQEDAQGTKHDLTTPDVEIPGGTFQLGASRDAAFVFDNEKWGHSVAVEPLAMARTAVTQGEFAAFVSEDGYRRAELWSADGWRWREETGAEHPVYWKSVTKGQWLRRHFDQWLALEPELPVIHVNWFEADAYCRWAGRRLPSEAEWELAATAGNENRHYPWGEDPPSPEQANLDWQRMAAVHVAAQAPGDSAHGCRQMIGNVWEWTATTFNPYPGFVADPYKEYSQPCYGECKVLRGGCWVTRSRLIRNTWRNFYRPDRRDVWAGFRTCAP